MTSGTPRAIGPLADQVLAWVAAQRDERTRTLHSVDRVAEIRRIELCALAAREAAMFHDLYGLTGLEGGPHAARPGLRDER